MPNVRESVAFLNANNNGFFKATAKAEPPQHVIKIQNMLGRDLTGST